MNSKRIRSGGIKKEQSSREWPPIDSPPAAPPTTPPPPALILQRAPLRFQPAFTPPSLYRRGTRPASAR